MTPKELQLMILTVIGIMSIITVYPYLENTFSTSRYTEMAVLGPNGLLGEYSQNITVGEKLEISIYLENHEKKIQLYEVQTKFIENFDEKNQTPPFLIEPISSNIMILSDRENSTIPMNIIFDKPMKGKLVFELNKYNSENQSYSYHNRWVALWVNILE